MYQALSPRWDRPLSVFPRLGIGALPALDQRVQELDAAGAIPPRSFVTARGLIGAVRAAQAAGSEAEQIDQARAGAAARFGDAHALDGGAAVIAAMAGGIVPVASRGMPMS